MQTDEFIILTPDGVVYSRSIKRRETKEQYNWDFLQRCVGAPWNPKGGTETQKQGDLLTPGGRLNRMYITTKILASMVAPTTVLRAKA